MERRRTNQSTHLHSEQTHGRLEVQVSHVPKRRDVAWEQPTEQQRQKETEEREERRAVVGQTVVTTADRPVMETTEQRWDEGTEVGMQTMKR